MADHEEQARVLASLSDDQRDFWARQFRIGNATYCCQNQFREAAGLEAVLTANEPGENFWDWLER